MIKNNKTTFKTLSLIAVLSLALVISACSNKTDTIASESLEESNINSESISLTESQSPDSYSQLENITVRTSRMLEGIYIKDNLFLYKDDGNYSLINITAKDNIELKPGNKYSFEINEIMTSLPAQANTDKLELIGSAIGEKLPWESLQALEMLTEYENIPVHLVDVRTESEFKDGHIPNSLNIPLDSISSIKETVPKTDVIVVYCRSGNRSANAAKELENLGYSLVFDLSGIQDYKGDIEK